MTYTVYVLHSPSTGLMYVGQTAELTRRLSQHLGGESFWTKRCKDWEVIYTELFESRVEAMRRERYLKTGKGKEELKRLLIHRGGL
ncbi:MAG: GIY-YIG nuclease family protein [Terriglobia bacterium]